MGSAVSFVLSYIMFKEWREEEWKIGDTLHCNYKDVKSFLMDIDWDLLCYIINQSWFDACHKETLNDTN